MPSRLSKKALVGRSRVLYRRRWDDRGRHVSAITVVGLGHVASHSFAEQRCWGAPVISLMPASLTSWAGGRDCRRRRR